MYIYSINQSIYWI